MRVLHCTCDRFLFVFCFGGGGGVCLFVSFFVVVVVVFGVFFFGHPNHRGSHIPSLWMVHAGGVFVAGIHPSRT